MKATRFTVFHFETPDSHELAKSLSEAPLLEAACRLAGQPFAPFCPVSGRQFGEQLAYVFRTWDTVAKSDKRLQFAIHLSCHGGESGVWIGGEELSWPQLAELIGKVNRRRKIPFVLVLSACGHEQLQLSAHFREVKSPPRYVFSFENEVAWQDAALVWALLYRGIGPRGRVEHVAMRRLVGQIRALDLDATLRYHVWEDDRYKTIKRKG